MGVNLLYHPHAIPTATIATPLFYALLIYNLLYHPHHTLFLLYHPHTCLVCYAYCIVNLLYHPHAILCYVMPIVSLLCVPCYACRPYCHPTILCYVMPVSIVNLLHHSTTVLSPIIKGKPPKMVKGEQKMFEKMNI